jgi:repressor LexA
VVGQSMIGAHIADGDLLVVEEDEDPPDGTVVAALIGDGEEVTVKRLYREKNEAGDLLRLKPENGDHQDLVVSAENVTIQGRVVYVVHPPRGRYENGPPVGAVREPPSQPTAPGVVG